MFLWILLSLVQLAHGSEWADWWSYTGPGGPHHWSYMNPEWKLCKTGRYQSPIDIEPRLLLFDPQLRRIAIEMPTTISGVLHNTGNDLTFVVDTSIASATNFSDGPFMYTYRAAEIKVHFGKTDSRGSEHTINGRSFAAEIQIICYNTDLFSSLSEAKTKPYGVAVLAIFAEIARNQTSENIAFAFIVDRARRIPWRGQSIQIAEFHLVDLIPQTNAYITYDGSFTQPGCQETVTWAIFNRPIYVSHLHLSALRQLQANQPDTEMVMTEGNIRPVMPIHNRPIRTNINHKSPDPKCTMKRVSIYEVNEAVLS